MDNKNKDNLNGKTGTSKTNPVKNSALFPTGEGGKANGSFISAQPGVTKKVNTSIIGDGIGSETKIVNGTSVATVKGNITRGVNMSFKGKPEAAPTDEFNNGAYDADFNEGPGGYMDNDVG